MENNNKHLNDLKEIRTMMERSSRFISLSGLSGIFAGVAALAGALALYIYWPDFFFGHFKSPISLIKEKFLLQSEYNNLLIFILIDALIVLILAFLSGILFTTRNARKKGLPYWDSSAKRMLVNLFIPLTAGGIFCLALLYHQLINLIAPTTLIFYGLALINASKFTLNDIRYLGFSEIILGLWSLFFIKYGIIFWTVGFGILHIIYGSTMYWKNERSDSKY